MERPTQHSQEAIPRYPPVIPNPGPLALLPAMKERGSLASQELKINQLISICLMGCSARLKQQIPPAMVGEGWFVEPNLLEGKTLTETAGRNRGIMSVHHIHHHWLTSVTAGYREMTSSIKLQSIPELSCTLRRIRPNATSWPCCLCPYMCSMCSALKIRKEAMHDTQHAKYCVFCHVLWLILSSS